MWEIFTLGSNPYAHMTNAEVCNAVPLGYRLEQPRFCPDQLYELMWQCTQHDPEQRPSFADLIPPIESILNGHGNYLDAE